MKAVIRIVFLIGIIVLTTFGCEKEEQHPPYRAEGKIIAVFGGCYGEWIMIEVYKPKGIGSPGYLPLVVPEERIDYQNAIGVPYFTRMPYIPDTIQVGNGSYLYFKCREVTNDDLDLFIPENPQPCLWPNYIPPAKFYIITEVIDYY